MKLIIWQRKGNFKLNMIIRFDGFRSRLPIT